MVFLRKLFKQKEENKNDFPLWFFHLESRFYFSVFRSVCVKYFLY